MSDNMTAEEFLEHYGVKGMKWGVTRDEATLRRMQGQRVRARGGTRQERKDLNAQLKSDWKSYKKSTTRKERKADARASQQSKADYLVDIATKHSDTALIQVGLPGGQRIVATGEEFVEHMALGGAMNAKTSEIYGYLDK